MMNDAPEMPIPGLSADGSQDYYQVLRLRPDASKLDVINGYRRAKLAFRKDSLAVYSLYGKDDLKRIRQQIDLAYGVLSDREKRRVYDEEHGFTHCEYDGHGHEGGDAHHDVSSDDLRVTDTANPSKLSLPDNDIDSRRGANVVNFPAKLRKIDPDPELEQRILAIDVYSGEFLREVRESRGICLRDVAAHTRISMGYLKAIEAEDSTALPAVAYLKGYLAQYAAEIGLEPHRVVQSYPPLADY